MKRHVNHIPVLALIFILWSCGGAKDPEPALPAYLQIPGTLSGYKGSGLITINGGPLNLRAEGAEHLDPATKTYSGIVGQILEPDALIDFTLGQPNTYRERFLSDKETRANGELRIVNTIKAGTYPMGLEAKPLPTGETADLVLYLPGPQLYLTRTGTLTVANSTVIKQEGTTSLYRLTGSFLVAMYGSGTGIPQGQGDIPITGSFDVLLSDNK